MHLTPVDYLLAFLYIADRDQTDMELVSERMVLAGFSKVDIAEAQAKARRFGYTRVTSLDGHELTPMGLARGIEAAKILGI